MKMAREKMFQIARDMVRARDEAARRGDVVIRRQIQEDLRVLLPKALWAAFGVK